MSAPLKLQHQNWTVLSRMSWPDNLLFGIFLPINIVQPGLVLADGQRLPLKSRYWAGWLMKVQSLTWHRLCFISSEFTAGKLLRAPSLNALKIPCLVVCLKQGSFIIFMFLSTRLIKCPLRLLVASLSLENEWPCHTVSLQFCSFTQIFHPISTLNWFVWQ